MDLQRPPQAGRLSPLNIGFSLKFGHFSFNVYNFSSYLNPLKHVLKKYYV